MVSYGLVYMPTSGLISFSLATENNSWHDYLSSDSLQPDTWYHVVGVYDGASVKIYLNGQLNSQYAGVSGPLLDAGGSLLVGHEDTWTSEFLSGAVDELAIWNRALSARDVGRLYHAAYVDPSLPNWHSGLVAGYT